MTTTTQSANRRAMGFGRWAMGSFIRAMGVSRWALVGTGFAVLMAVGHAQQPQRFLYAALPGVGGGNNMTYGGAGILVFDIDHGHKFVRRIPLQGVPPAPAANGRGRGNAQEAIKGIAANAETGRLYVSTSRRTAAYDLLTDK